MFFNLQNITTLTAHLAHIFKLTCITSLQLANTYNFMWPCKATWMWLIWGWRRWVVNSQGWWSIGQHNNTTKLVPSLLSWAHKQIILNRLRSCSYIAAKMWPREEVENALKLIIHTFHIGSFEMQMFLSFLELRQTLPTSGYSNLPKWIIWRFKYALPLSTREETNLRNIVING